MRDIAEGIFGDRDLVGRIQRKLPYLFQLAEVESSRAGKTGMQVGSLRERILVALLVYRFGAESVETEIPMVAPEEDVRVCGRPISIKTITGPNLGGVKVVWTVDPQKATQFRDGYEPTCDILLVQIVWSGSGTFCFIPLSVQRDHFAKMGREGYLKLPKPGTNPRGVEFAKEALSALIGDSRTSHIVVQWQRSDISYDPHARWVDYWREE